MHLYTNKHCIHSTLCNLQSVTHICNTRSIRSFAKKCSAYHELGQEKWTRRRSWLLRRIAQNPLMTQGAMRYVLQFLPIGRYCGKHFLNGPQKLLCATVKACLATKIASNGAPGHSKRLRSLQAVRMKLSGAPPSKGNTTQTDKKTKKHKCGKK